MGYRVLRLSINILVFWVAEFQAEISEDWSYQKMSILKIDHLDLRF